MEGKKSLDIYLKLHIKNKTCYMDISTACTGNYIFIRNFTGSLSLSLERWKKKDIFIPIRWLKKYKSNPKEQQEIYYLKSVKMFSEQNILFMFGLYQHCFSKSLTNWLKSSENPLKKSDY